MSKKNKRTSEVVVLEENIADEPKKEPMEETFGIKQPLAGDLVETSVIVFDGPDIIEMSERGYGKIVGENRLELSMVEAIYLADKKKLTVRKDDREVPVKELMKEGVRINSDLHTIYTVYKDLRERGLTVKTGYKFGCHFRVYERGVRIRHGPKEAHEHTKWIVFAVAEDYTCSFPELSRAVRLAHNIRAKMLWAIVDTDNDVTYYRIERIKP